MPRSIKTRLGMAEDELKRLRRLRRQVAKAYRILGDAIAELEAAEASAAGDEKTPISAPSEWIKNGLIPDPSTMGNHRFIGGMAGGRFQASPGVEGANVDMSIPEGSTSHSELCSVEQGEHHED